MKLACFQEEFTQAATDLLAKHGKTLEDVKTPAQAWEVCWRCDRFSLRCYDAGANDAHIQTLLEKVFPNVAFREKKRY